MRNEPSPPPKLTIGDLQLTVVHDGGFRLDGGAMFGVVPRELWRRKMPPDEANRIAMTTHCPLVERGDDLLLIDTGVGGKGDEKFNQIFAVDETIPRLPEQIRAAGYEPGDITHVLLTHLHFDHCGWNTRRAGRHESAPGGGEWVPTFPNARYFMARGEVEHGREPNVRDRASYDPRNWDALFAAGVVELFEDEIEVIPGVRAVRTPGHNRDMCVVTFADQPTAAEPSIGGIFWADLVPTAAHVALPWIMSYDLYPMETLANKQRLLPRAAEEGWICLFEHDPGLPVGHLVEDEKGRLQARPIAL